jgi:hypothetical protein
VWQIETLRIIPFQFKRVVVYIAEIRFGASEHMLPPPEKTFSKRQKILNKNLARTSRYLHARVKFRRKLIFFMSCVKKIKKKISHATLF